MPKLHLKRTPEEEAQHQRRKERKRKEREASNGSKRKRKPYVYDEVEDPLAQKRHRGDAGEGPSSEAARKWASSDEDEDEPAYGPQPATASASTFPAHGHKPDYDAIRAELEERRFREKMFDALGDDERLDSVETKLNDFAHVPDRWRTARGGGTQKVFEDEFEDVLRMDPQVMDEEEYAEWIRLGMYRKTHADEYAEQLRKKAAQAARKAEEKARKAETARLEKEAEEERKRKKRERESRRWDYAREEYHVRWKILLAPNGVAETESKVELRFEDIPWPVVAAHRQKKPEKKHRSSRLHELPDEAIAVSLDDLTEEAISAFILPLVSAEAGDDDEGQKKRERKEKLRETFLRFHPDKFEGRFMGRVKEGDRERVREGIGQVSRVLNALMG